MAHPKRLILCVALAVLAATGCDGAARPVDGQPGSGEGCTTCHGDATRVTDSPLVKAAPATGAHLAHLQGSTFRDPIACAECHPVTTSAAHSNQTVDFAWGPLASARGATPSYDPASGTCTNACHGAAPSPAWTADVTLDCTSCHGHPPASAPHDPSKQDCSVCHPGTVLATGELNREAKLHLDGEIEAGGMHPTGWSDPARHGQAAMTGLAGCAACHGADYAGGTSGISCTACHAAAGHASWATECTFCHGDRASGRASPPVDTHGLSLVTNVSVGAHDAHVGATLSSPVACEACHPSRVGSDVRTDAAHVDGDGVAEVQFGALAKTGGKTPVYSRASATSATCASTYCHGNFSGGTVATTSWTSTTPMTCTSCHGSPPDTGKHTFHVGGLGLQCANCHASVVDAARAITAPALHVNGTKEVQFGGTWGTVSVKGTWSSASRSCSGLATGCHGSKSW
ncbi:CxxxxCH/CxxCH domain c-type cytochrome [Anaeromyxobacter sp. SG26]|uniref:CxxxxCH/CxxCH domain c-type cytochrome n=1 Tax=Anaeromyxobacter sp. SG26 TaxID=2925407 RepID=UPI001F5AEF23|nr:CxxxxCH/CxxCH domain-containing protein [Anaeromyxobacter sp. SG26]